jgi:hypothetical protein
VDRVHALAIVVDLDVDHRVRNTPPVTVLERGGEDLPLRLQEQVARGS